MLNHIIEDEDLLDNYNRYDIDNDGKLSQQEFFPWYKSTELNITMKVLKSIATKKAKKKTSMFETREDGLCGEMDPKFIACDIGLKCANVTSVDNQVE